MSFARVQTQDREVNQLQNNIATALRPFEINPILAGRFLNEVSLINGTTTIYHSLGRPLLGWMITDIDGAATVYSSQSSNLTPELNLVLVSNAQVNVNLYVF